jgi:hypothetical protein
VTSKGRCPSAACCTDEMNEVVRANVAIFGSHAGQYGQSPEPGTAAGFSDGRGARVPVWLAPFRVRDRVQASDFVHDRPERIALPPEDKF